MPVRVDPETRLAELRSRPERQLLGQFFTPEPLADYLAESVLKIRPDSVLDPAVGGGRLLRALPNSVGRFGIDVDPHAIEQARSSLPADVELARGDFLDAAGWPLTQPTFDAIVANPPYVRHHKLRYEQKARRAELNDRLGIELTSYADYYIYFFCEAVRRLNPGGRLAFVTPALFLGASYGTALKYLLLRDGTIEEITVFDNNRGVFHDARTVAAVTVFTKQTSRRHVVFREAELNGRVQHVRSRRLHPNKLDPSKSWHGHLPSRQTVDVDGVRLGDIIRVRRGLATGSNSFFCLTESERKATGIPDDYLCRVLSSGRGLPELRFTLHDWQTRLERGERGWLLWCSTPLTHIRSKRLRAYLDQGEALGVHLRTTCQRNTTLPWYAVENVDPPDFIFTYMSKRPLRFIENVAGVRTLTALMGGWLRPDVSPVWARMVLRSEMASCAMTAAAQDLGEGLRKIEPRRLAEVVIPIGDTLRRG